MTVEVPANLTRSAAYWSGWDSCARGRPLWEQEDTARTGWLDRAAVEGKGEGMGNRS